MHAAWCQRFSTEYLIQKRSLALGFIQPNWQCQVTGDVTSRWARHRRHTTAQATRGISMPSSVVFFSVTCPQHSVSCPVTVLRYVEQQNGSDFVRSVLPPLENGSLCSISVTYYWLFFMTASVHVTVKLNWTGGTFVTSFHFVRKGENTSTFSCNVMCNAIILWCGIYEVQVCKTSRILRNSTYCTNVFKFLKKKKKNRL